MSHAVRPGQWSGFPARAPADWQPYNPNVERDARIEAEGLYTDPIHQFTTFDQEEDDPEVEPAALDFNL